MNNNQMPLEQNVQPQMNTGGNVAQQSPAMQEPQPAPQPAPQQMDTQPMEEAPQMENGGEIDAEVGKLILNWGEVFTFFK